MILRFITAALCASLLVSACYTPIEGCLDTEATNFDASADKDCCCKYPLLVLNVENAYDTLIWKPDTAYQNDLGQWFRIRDIVFYVSELKLTQNGVSGVVEDTITLSRFASPTSNDTIKSLYTDDFLLIRRVPTTQYTVGTFRPSAAGGARQSTWWPPFGQPKRKPLARPRYGLRVCPGRFCPRHGGFGRGGYRFADAF